jgi:hypothetical protein
MASRPVFILVAAAMSLCARLAFSAAPNDQAALAAQVASAPITLQQALAAAETRGQPISGKFEIHEGHLRLSVDIIKESVLQEIVIGHTTGRIVRLEPITAAQDVTAATGRVAAMAKASKALKTAVDEAEQDAMGYRAVSVVPKLRFHHAVATVMLLKGNKFKSVSEQLE